MQVLDISMIQAVSGGDYLFTMDLSVPENSLGLSFGYFFNGYLVNSNTTNQEIIRTLVSLTNRFPYLPLTSIISMDLKPAP